KYTSNTTVRLGLRGTGGTPESASTTAAVTTTWQRFTFTKTFTGAATGNAQMFIDDNANASAVNVYSWGGQVVTGSSPQVYARATASAITASAGVVSNG